MAKIEKFLTEKGKPLLVYDSYIYTLERTTNIKLIFRYENRDCKGRFHTNLTVDMVVSDPVTHSHAPNLNKISVIKLQNEIKSHVIIGEELSSNILHSALRDVPLEAVGSLSKDDSLTRSIRRQSKPEPLIGNSRLPDDLKKNRS